MRSATYVSASSQVAVFQASLPRSPVRISGVRRRSGSLIAPGAPLPRGHSRPRLCGSIGLPSNFHTLPSRTEAKPAQRQKHISQKVETVLTSPGGAAAWARWVRGGIWVAAAPAPNVAAEIFRNLRRESAFICVLVVECGTRFPHAALRRANCTPPVTAPIDAAHLGRRQRGRTVTVVTESRQKSNGRSFPRPRRATARGLASLTSTVLCTEAIKSRPASVTVVTATADAAGRWSADYSYRCPTHATPPLPNHPARKAMKRTRVLVLAVAAAARPSLRPGTGTRPSRP